MKDRIKALRKELGLTQEKFADRLSIKRNTIANYEIGRNEPIDAVISLICKEFNVDEKWLRTGDGEMFRAVDRETEIAEIAADLFNNDKSLKSKLIMALAKLDDEDLRALLRIATALVDTQKEND